ncbi:MAG: hypothetical protein ABI830_00015 [Pseudolabrys sp.]
MQPPHAPRRRHIHRQCIGLDCNTKDTPSSVGWFDGTAAFTAPQRKMFAGALPHNVAAPAQLTANHRRRQAHGLKPRHGDMPAMVTHPEAAVAVGALYVTAGVPVVFNVVDKTEPQPDGIGKFQLRHRARHIRLVKNPVGRKRKSPIGKAALVPATRHSRPTTFRRRILLVELIRHEPVNFRRQTFLECSIRTARQKHIMSFVDPGRRQQKLPGNRNRDDRHGSRPSARAGTHFTAENNHRQRDQQCVAGQIIKRQADHGQTQKKSTQLKCKTVGLRGGKAVGHSALISPQNEGYQSTKALSAA